MGLGDSRPLGSRALFLWATALLFSVLANRKYLLCYNEVSFLCPRSRLPFYWLLSTVVVIFLYKGYHLTGGHRPTYALGKHLSVCTSSVLNLRWPGVPRSTLCFSLVKQGMTAPTDVLLFGLYCTAIFCFYSFPMVIFSWLSQSNRQLTVNSCSAGHKRAKSVLCSLAPDRLRCNWCKRSVKQCIKVVKVYVRVTLNFHVFVKIPIFLLLLFSNFILL